MEHVPLSTHRRGFLRKRISIHDMLSWSKVEMCFLFRSSHPEVFSKKVALRNFAKFTGIHKCHSLFFNKIAGLRPAALLKKGLWHRCFPVNFAKFLTTPFLTEHLQWLLLSLQLFACVLNIASLENLSKIL